MAKKIKRSKANCGNYYGSPAVWQNKDGKFVMGVEDWDGWDDGESVSVEFAQAWFAEFGQPK